MAAINRRSPLSPRNKQGGFLLNPFRFGGGGAISGDPSFNHVSLLLPASEANNSVNPIDSSPRPKTLTASGTAKVSTSQAKWGSGALSFAGVSDYFSIPDDVDLNFQGNNFSIEGWVYFNSLTGFQAIITKKATGVNYAGYQIYKADPANGNKLIFTATSTGTTWELTLTSSMAMVATTWTFFQVTRTGNVWNMNVNGVNAATTTLAISIADNANPVLLGISKTALDAPLNGYLDDFRITKWIVRGLAVPTEAFPTSYVPPILDTYAGAVSGWSMARKLKSAATNAWKVRRSSDSTTADVALVTNGVDTPSALTFCGANTGVVDTLYDQVGTAHLANATNANRPTVIASGVLNSLNGLAAMVLDSTDYLDTSVASASYGTAVGLSGDPGFSVFIVHKKTLNTAGHLFGWGDTAVSLHAIGQYDDGSTASIAFAGGNGFPLTVPTNSAYYLTSVHKSPGAIGANTSVYRNGVAVNTGTPSTNTPAIDGTKPFVLGRWANVATSFQGSIQEVIVFGSNQSANRAAIEANINAFYGIF